MPGRPAPEQDGRQRRVAAREPLADAEDVGPHAGLLGGEPGAEPAEAGDDLVEDQQHSGLVAERAQPAQVLGGERVTPAVSSTGSTMIGRNGARALVLDHIAQLGEAPERARAGAGAAGPGMGGWMWSPPVRNGSYGVRSWASPST